MNSECRVNLLDFLPSIYPDLVKFYFKAGRGKKGESLICLCIHMMPARDASTINLITMRNRAIIKLNNRLPFEIPRGGVILF